MPGFGTDMMVVPTYRNERRGGQRRSSLEAERVDVEVSKSLKGGYFQMDVADFRFRWDRAAARGSSFNGSEIERLRTNPNAATRLLAEGVRADGCTRFTT